MTFFHGALSPDETQRFAVIPRQEKLAIFMDVFRGHPELIEHWGHARTVETRRATSELFEAVVRCDPKAVQHALRQGAAHDARLNDVLELQHIVDEPPPLRTPLDLAVWRQTHNTLGDSVCGRKSDYDVLKTVRDVGVVSALLAAGAVPDAMVLRRFHEQSWERMGHPVFNVLQTRLLDSLAPTESPLVPVHEAYDPILNVVPEGWGAGKVRPPHLWIHRAILTQHWAAMNGWFDRGGTLGTLNSDCACALMWSVKATSDPVAWAQALNVVRAQLLNTPEALYRREVLSLLASVAQEEGIVSMDPIDQPMAWALGLMQERPLSTFALTPADLKLSTSWYVEHFSALVKTLEHRWLSEETRHTMPNLEARVRARL